METSKISYKTDLLGGLSESDPDTDIFGEDLLESRFPLSTRLVWMSVFPWILCLFAAVMAIEFTDIERVFMSHDIEFLLDPGIEALVFLLTIVLVLGGKVLYAILYNRSLHLYYCGENLIIERGVILKTRESYEMRRVAATVIGQSLLGFIMGIYYIEIISSLSRAKGPIRLQGFSRKTAGALQTFLHVGEKN